MIYYVVLLEGVPLDVTTIYSKAQLSQKELSVPGKSAIILPCVPVQREFDFSDEEPTQETSDEPEPDFM